MHNLRLVPASTKDVAKLIRWSRQTSPGQLKEHSYRHQRRAIERSLADSGRIRCHIICLGRTKVGFIENFWFSERFRPFGLSLPIRTACFHIVIGEASHRGQGIGTAALDTLIKLFFLPILRANAVLAFPTKGNAAAIKSYRRIGFKVHMRKNGRVYLVRYLR